MRHKLRTLYFEEKGQGMTEYGIVLGGIAVGAFLLIVALSKHAADMFTRVSEALESRN